MLPRVLIFVLCFLFLNFILLWCIKDTTKEIINTRRCTNIKIIVNIFLIFVLYLVLGSMGNKEIPVSIKKEGSILKGKIIEAEPQVNGFYDNYYSIKIEEDKTNKVIEISSCVSTIPLNKNQIISIYMPIEEDLSNVVISVNDVMTDYYKDRIANKNKDKIVFGVMILLLWVVHWIWYKKEKTN